MEIIEALPEEEKEESNIAFIDGQNLHLGTKEGGWSIDHARFRVYLSEKYHIQEASYFVGYMFEKEQGLYNNLQKAGFSLLFKPHPYSSKSSKKGNVDSDIIFEVMKKLVENEAFDRAFIVSCDGDYKKLIDYLISKNKFGKILFPNKKFASSLYMNLGAELFDYLEDIDAQSKIRYLK